MSPEDLLIRLKKESSPRIQQSLDAIFTVCKEQQERGVSDFSISTVSKLGYNRGVPKAQSIRNKSGDVYKALIQAFADKQAQGKKTRNPSAKDSDWIEEIENPKHKLLVRIMASKLKEAQQMIHEIIPPKQRIDIYDHKNMLPDQSYKFTDQEIRALQYLLSNEFQKKWSLKPSEYGELVDESDTPVFKAATLNALLKALENLS